MDTAAQTAARRDGGGVAICLSDESSADTAAAAVEAIGREVTIKAHSLAELTGAGRGGRISCVILGAHRPDEQLQRSVTTIRHEIGPIPIVAICDRAGAADIRRALRFGVDGVVLTRQVGEALSAVLAATYAGQTSVPGPHRAELGTEPLSSREKQVLILVARGLTNAQIAGRLYLAESTVKSHLSTAFGKLNVSSRHEAAEVILDPDRGGQFGIFLGNSVPREASSA
jgi:DNA-binding NarL/FixJ family response regulator